MYKVLMAIGVTLGLILASMGLGFIVRSLFKIFIPFAPPFFVSLVDLLIWILIYFWVINPWLEDFINNNF